MAILILLSGGPNASLPGVVNGSCPTNTRPVYRAYNIRADANHRYSLSSYVIDDMEHFQRIAEEYGPAAVAMCAID